MKVKVSLKTPASGFYRFLPAVMLGIFYCLLQKKRGLRGTFAFAWGHPQGMHEGFGCNDEFVTGVMMR